MLQSDPLNITEDISITLMDKEGNINFVVVPGSNQAPKLIYRHKLVPNETYHFMESIVNFKNKLRPSMYHQVEQENHIQAQPMQETSHDYEYMIQSKLIGTLQQQAKTIGSKN